jgi:sugar phosphate permease
LPFYFAVKAVNGFLQSPCWAINLVLMSNWFPRTGRGILLGIWGCNTSIGNIIGAQAFKYFGSGDDLATPFYAIAVLVGAAGFLSLILVIEQPADVNMTVEKE